MSQRRLFTRALPVAAALCALSVLDGVRRAQPVHARAFDSQSAQPTGSAPDIHFEVTKHDFGQITQETQARYEFHFVNRGGSNLEIGDIRAACGCTAALASGNVIPPGGQGSIAVTFDARGKKGPFAKTVSVGSNDPDQPQLILTVQGNIQSFLEVEPGFAAFGNNLPKGQGAEQRVRLWREGAAFRITGIDSDSPLVKAEAVPFQEGARQGFDLLMRLDKATPPGRHSGIVRVRTDVQQAPEVELRYFGGVRGQVTVSPKYAIVGSVPSGEAVTRSVLIEQSREGEPMQILGVTDPAPYVESRVTELEAGRRYELVITVLASAPEGSLRGEILVRTSLEDESELRVPVYGFIGQDPEAHAEVE
jgi:hypothetical protein